MKLIQTLLTKLFTCFAKRAIPLSFKWKGQLATAVFDEPTPMTFGKTGVLEVIDVDIVFPSSGIIRFAIVGVFPSGKLKVLIKGKLEGRSYKLSQKRIYLDEPSVSLMLVPHNEKTHLGYGWEKINETHFIHSKVCLPVQMRHSQVQQARDLQVGVTFYTN
jgi:hypothetical protein